MQFFSQAYYGPDYFATFYAAIPLESTLKSKAVCQLLGVTPATLKRYLSGNVAIPKSAVRLLFHECHYGRSATDTHSHTGHVLALKQAQSLQLEVDRLRLAIEVLELENQQLKTSNNEPRLFAANATRYRS